MSLLEALILGIIQGLTEFLPVSSSGHLELGTALLGVQSKDNLLFAIIVHAATALSTIVIFRKDILGILISAVKFEIKTIHFVLQLVVSAIPVAIIGLFFEDQLEAFFGGKVSLVGLMLLLTGVLLWISEKYKQQERSINYKRATIIGIAQAIAVLPGISRSGATIATALSLGVKKSEAARFSFLMALAPILGVTLLKFLDYIELQQTSASALPTLSWQAMLIGFAAAFFTGLLACKWMIRIVNKGKLKYFAWYCFAVGIIAIVAGFLG